MYSNRILLLAKEKDMVAEYKSDYFVEIYDASKAALKETAKRVELLKIADNDFIS